MKNFGSIFVACFCLTLSTNVLAEKIEVAVAANFLKPLKTLAQDFEADTGHQIVLHPGSSGQLYAQILYGAPFDLFLSADEERIDALQQKDLTNSESLYSCGLLAVYSENQQITKLEDLNGISIAIANPKLAPYGKAAQQVLTRKSLLPKKIVQAQNVATAYQYADTQVVDASFVAYSYVYQKPADNFWLVPKDLYQPIKQKMALLKSSKKPAVEAFYHYLLSESVQNKLSTMGYTSVDDCSF